MDIDESWQVVVDHRLALAELLAGLSEADWERPSLCAGWRVRDVAAHVTLIPRPPSPGSLLVDFAKACGNYDRFNTVASRRRAARTPTGIDFPTPPGAGAAAATRIWDLRWPFSLGVKRRLGLFRLAATDADWTIGTGPEIAGPVSAILLLLTGRTEAAAPLLTGDGVGSLATS